MTGKKTTITHGDWGRMLLYGHRPDYVVDRRNPPSYISLITPWPVDEQCQLRHVCVDESGPDRAEFVVPHVVVREITRYPDRVWKEGGPLVSVRVCRRCYLHLAFWPSSKEQAIKRSRRC